jgi:HSP20 family protein
LAFSPFSLLQRFFTNDIADVLRDGRAGRGLAPRGRGTGLDLTAWEPNVDIVQVDNELVVRADLPGLTPDEVTVEISDDAITLSGERQQEREEDHGGVYRMERTYGAFYRVIPLPDGAVTDRATATFRDGVLEIRMPAPPEQVSLGRRLEVSREDRTGGTSGQPASEANRS